MTDLVERLRKAAIDPYRPRQPLYEAADEIERLRQIIADAPHDAICCWWNAGDTCMCDCWKSRVAKEGEGE